MVTDIIAGLVLVVYDVPGVHVSPCISEPVTCMPHIKLQASSFKLGRPDRRTLLPS